MFDINGGEFLIIAILAVILVGPERLPEYARQFRAWVRKVRDALRHAEDSVKTEMGATEFARFDPRQYDPRRIVRDALDEPQDGPQAAPRRQQRLAPGAVAPFDGDAT